ncbi:MAG TPA: isochorismatase family protein [Actinopolymorphaceae bacterium]|nr:isochorismatase family protein [Actinopolymorphaceae bacterium]
MTTARTSLIVVDMQNAFLAPSSGRPVGGEQLVAEVNGWVAHAAHNDWPTFYTKDVAPGEYPPGDPDRQVELVDGLDVRGVVVPKGPGRNKGFSGFVLTAAGVSDDEPGAGGLSPLAGHLRHAGVAAVVVIGVAADVCVSATARDARRLGYDVTVPLAATAFVHANPDGDDAAVAALRAGGVTVTGTRP